MKKLLLLFLFVTTFSNAQIVNIPDANFKGKLLEANSSNYIAKNLLDNFFKIDANDDDEIQVSEALQVSSLNLYNSNISDLASIQSFANLQNLECGFNLLTELDVNGLVNLRILGCQSNQLTSLDLSGLVNLNFFYCINNNLNSLNIKNGSNQLVTDIHSDFNGNPNLQIICADEVEISSVQILVDEYGYTSCVVTSDCSLSNENFTNNNFSVVPNPVKNSLNIQSKNDIEISSISIYNTLGQLVFVLPNAEKTTSIDVSQLTTGTYFVKIISNKGMATSKFIKE